MNIYIVMKLKKLLRIFKIWLLYCLLKNLFFINFNIFEYYDIVVEKYYCFLNILLLNRVCIKCMYMDEVIVLDMCYLCIVEYVFCVGEGIGRRSISLILCMLWENGRIMYISMLVR